MIYCCENCHFIFARMGEAEACPDCGKPVVREATDEEKREYQRRITRDANKKQN